MSPPTSSPSLLANRQQAVRQWEVTQVNELLEQLSDYPGVVVLATNRLDALDEAVMRRMDAKIHFDVLQAPQLALFLNRLCTERGLIPTAQQLQAVQQLQGLTPGDFACVSRRLAFAPLRTGQEASTTGVCTEPVQDDMGAEVEAVLALLRQELKLKTRGRAGIGFLGGLAPCL